MPIDYAKMETFELDVHTHILPEKWPNLKQKYGYGGWICLNQNGGQEKYLTYDDGRFFRKVEDNCLSPETRLHAMDSTGVNVQLLSTVPVMFSYWAKGGDAADFSRFLNDHIASVVRVHPQRFLGAATVPLQDPTLAADELKRCVVDLGLKAVQIGSHVNEWNLDNRALDPFYKAAEDLKMPIFVHPWDMETSGRMTKYWLPWLVGMPCETTVAICSLIMGGVLERFPTLKFCFAHGAGAFPYLRGRIEHGFQVRPDLCAVDNAISPSSYVHSIYADTLVHDEDALRLLLKTFGEDKILLGSDYPFPLGESVPGKLVSDSSNLLPNTKECVLGRNALKILDIDIEHFMH